jgi:magnesium transporter
MLDPGMMEAASRLRTVVCRGGVSVERDVPLGEVAAHVADPDDVVWTDVRAPTDEVLDELVEIFGIEPAALEDLQRSRLQEFKTHLLLTAHALRVGPGGPEIEVDPVALFVGRNFVLTVQWTEVPALDDASSRWLAGGTSLARGVPFVVSRVLDALLATYLPAIERVDDRLDAAEAEIFAAAGSLDVQVLIRLKREVTGLRRILQPLQDNLKVLLRADNRLLWPELREAFHDEQGELLRILELLDSEREMVTTTLEASFSVASDKLNQTMKSLALITVILAVASSIFGAWGMNFDALPLTHSPWGFRAVIGVTLVLIALAAMVGRRR